MNKIKTLLESGLLEGLTTFITSTSRLVFDDRSYYGCKFKCHNYNRRCFCPPHSDKYIEGVKDKKYALIFAKSIKYSDLEMNSSNNLKILVKASDQDKSEIMEMYNAAEKKFQDIIKPVLSFWGLNDSDLFSAGFSMEECDSCFRLRKNRERGIKEGCFPMPSASAFKIDIVESMNRLNYNMDLNTEAGMVRIAVIFTDNEDCLPYMDQSFRDGDDPFPSKADKAGMARKKDKEIGEKRSPMDFLPSLFPDVEFKEINSMEILPFVKEKYAWLHLWKKAVLWGMKSPRSGSREIDKVSPVSSVNKKNRDDSDRTNHSEMMRKIHIPVFREGFYYSHEFLTAKILENRDGNPFSEYVGIEFYD